MGVTTTTLPEVTFSGGGVDRTAAARGAALGHRLLARCGDWLRCRNDATRLRDMEPHLVRDIGAAPACECRPDGFAVDPRPLWGVGLTPLPTAMAPPWSGDHRGG
jgi:hypothetical protein